MKNQELVSKAQIIAADNYVKNGKNMTSAYNCNELRLLVGGQFTNKDLSSIVINSYNEVMTELLLNN